MSLQGLVAQRFAGKPLRQPRYSMRHVPSALPNLEYSTIHFVDQREHFTDSMSEMVLLCNQVMRKKAVKTGKGASKPLSLEYIADRCDVDDPIFGYMVRTSKKMDKLEKAQDEHWQQGMMQGFVTCTTFTNWQKSFRWDSLHDSAFAYDDTELAEQMISERKYDKDGSLAIELQNTVRCGDPWNEGIVWPRIAEISLLGAMGCGRALLSLVIEKLECMPPSAKHNYDYLVLQATNNSIPFYESMGFIRVGCITENNKRGIGSENVAPESNPGTPSPHRSRRQEASPASPGQKSEIVSSPVIKVSTEENGETVLDYAKKYNCDAWDIVFLSEPLYPGMTVKSPLMKGTHLFIPDTSKSNEGGNSSCGGSDGSSSIQWYYCEDNETPKEISDKFGANAKDLLNANKGRIEGLQMHSKLIEGTKIQVSGFDRHHEDYVPYCHWTFPDSEFEDSEPSYMMARRLNRKAGAAAKERPVENSFSSEIVPYDPMSIPAVLNARTVEAPIKHETPERKQNSAVPVSKKRKRHPDQPLTPKKPRGAFFTFLNEEKQRLQKKELKVTMPDLTKISSQRWKNMSDQEKEPFIERDKLERLDFQKQMQSHKVKMEEFKAKHPNWFCADDDDEPSEPITKKLKKLQYKNLFNKVVKLNSDGQHEAGDEFKYYYVLTYIPDLFWCHLAPMRQDGYFNSQKNRSAGRPRWKLVHEGAGKELDISADVCEVVKARTMKGCADADKEEWDIVDDEIEVNLTKIVIPPQTIVTGTPSPKTVTIADESDSAMSVEGSMKENDTPSVDSKPKQPRIIHGRTPRARRSTKAKRSPPKSKSKPRPTQSKAKLMSSFDQHIDELRKFKEEHGHCMVPKPYKPNRSLSNWISNLNYSYSLSLKGLPVTIKLSQERLDKLSELGFEFTLMDVGSRGGGQVKKKKKPELPIMYPTSKVNEKDGIQKISETASSFAQTSNVVDPDSNDDTEAEKSSEALALDKHDIESLSLPDMSADVDMDLMIPPIPDKAIKEKKKSNTKKDGGFIQMSLQKYFKM